MRKELFGLLGLDIKFTRDLPRILEIGLLTPKNIRRNLPEELANFDGTIYVDQVKSDPLFKKPIDSFHNLTEICARHAVNILMLSRRLRTAGDLKESFEMRFTMFFDLYMVVTLEQRLSKAFHFWPRWPRVSNSKCFDTGDASTLFAMLNFCGELEICFGGWLFDVSNMRSNLRMLSEAVDLKFIDWIGKVSMFKEFFNGVGDLGFPEVVSADYDLKVELNRVIGGLRYEYEEAMASLTKAELSLPMSLKNWAVIFDVGINKIRQWKDDGKYYFVQKSPRKWALPITDLPAEYLEKYREQIDSK